MGVLCVVALPDSPSLSSRWLTEDEARYLTLRQVTRAVKADPDGPKPKIDWAVLWSTTVNAINYLESAHNLDDGCRINMMSF